MGLKRYAKKAVSAARGGAKKVGHFTPQGQAYQIFRGVKEGGLKGGIGRLNPVRALSGDLGGLMGKKNKDKSIDAGDVDPREAAAKKLIRKPYKGQAGAGQIEYTAEYEE